MFAARLILEIHGGTFLVTPADLGTDICERYMGSYFRHRRNQGRCVPCDAHAAYQTEDAPRGFVHELLWKHCRVFNDIQCSSGAWS